MEIQTNGTPVKTLWHLQIVHGVADCEGGPRGGWGWICLSHPGPVGLHGYVSLGDALTGASQHMTGCGHSGP